MGGEDTQCSLKPWQVSQIAGKIGTQNTKLRQTLDESAENMASLRKTWEGAAANATLGGYEKFAAEYFDHYYNQMNEYVDFLEDTVLNGYAWAEKVNEELAQNNLGVK
ncbi:MAG: WXG100 family type VII secretion target [Peptococcaceae bacterium]|nr:WXG100 family type VII secretion target [Peptococcaceae bacterium]